MRYIYLVLFFSFFSFSSKAQHLQLINDQGEVGAFMGNSKYFGDIYSDIKDYNINYGAFYKRQINAYIGLRLNYEKINLSADDNKSTNPYDVARAYYFKRDFHEISVLSELYFNRFITDRKDFRFSPYLGFGVGYLIGGSIDLPDSRAAINRIATMPINLGFKWNVYKQINLFGEVKYRFTTSDYVEHIPDNLVDTYQGIKSGKDEIFSSSIGLSYNFRKIYGPEKFKPSKKKKADIEDHSPKKRSKLLFFLPFNRK
jgi:hypothetical protein